MNQQFVTCSMCGHVFDPTLHATCQNCPLEKNCYLVCCPQCGYEMVNLQQSRIARWAARLFQHPKTTTAPSNSTLAGISPGQQARVIGFAGTISADRRAHLQSYGLLPGRVVRVLQHTPVTVIQVEHTELALERDMAKDIQVEAP